MNGFGEVLTAMVTPFDENLRVNIKELKNLASYLVSHGSDGLVVLGTTGEAPTLSRREKEEILSAVVEEVGDKTTIIAGTGSYSTAESIAMTQLAEEIGVDGIMLVVPYYNKPPQEGLYQHFKEIASRTSLPILLYNVPGRTSRNLEPSTVKKLAAIENIIALKEASGDLAQVSTLCRILPEGFAIYSGDDNLTLPILAVGGKGVVSVASHLVGPEIQKMIQYFKTGQVKEASRLNAQLGELFASIFLTTNPIPIKTALNLKGWAVGGVRPPLTEISPEGKEQLRQILKTYKLI